jgi:hypothetical protein
LPRHVKGVLFLDYVRMLRARKDVEWKRQLTPEDLAFLTERIEPDRWYPMQTFERLGLAILGEIARHDLLVVRAWGRLSAEYLVRDQSGLLVASDPRESLMRIQVLRGSFFDFDALRISELSDTSARVLVDYGMSNRAEQAASYQTLGFLGRLVELAGGSDVRASFEQRTWEGDPVTELSLQWELPARSA